MAIPPKTFSIPEIPFNDEYISMDAVSGLGGNGSPEGETAMSTTSKNTGFPKIDIVHYIVIAAVILTKLGSANSKFTVVSAPADVVTDKFLPPLVAELDVNVAPCPIT